MEGAPALDQTPCNGCTRCRHRCTAGIPITRSEYEAIRDHLKSLPPRERDAVLGQNKQCPWPGSPGHAYTACRFFDTRSGLCLVYPARPLVCRLFGHVEWLPCPIGKTGAPWRGGPALMAVRAAETHRTYEEWDAESPR